MMPMFLTVFLSNNDQHFTEVPVTPETLCRDVVELCKEPGEGDCYLAEMWRGTERAIDDGERMLDVLQRWGQQRGEVRFLLRHERAPRETGGPRASEHLAKRNMMKGTVDRCMENGVPPRMDITLSELQELASRQQQQINAQQQLLSSKEQRLHYLKLQDQQQQQQQASEQERLHQLRLNAQNQEAKLRRVRALKGQVEQKRLSNGKLVEEIEQMNGLFQLKQRELLSAVSRVEELSQQLETLKSVKMDALHDGPSSTGDLERLYKELQVRNKLNQDQNVKLQQQRESLNKRNLEVAAMDRRVAELRERLWKKKAALQHKDNLPLPTDNQGPQQGSTSRVAAVGPYIQSAVTACGPPVPSRQEVLVKPAYPDGTATLPMPESSMKAPPRPLKPASGFHPSKTSKVSDWTISNGEASGGHAYSATLPRRSRLHSQESNVETRGHTLLDAPPPIPSRNNQSSEDLYRDAQAPGKMPPPIPSKPKSMSQPGPAIFSKPPYSTGTFPGKAKPAAPYPRPPPPIPSHSHTLPLPPKQEAPPAATVRPFTPDPPEPPPPLLQKPQTVAASSIYSMYTQQPTPGKGYPQGGTGTLTRTQPRVYGKPVIPASGGQQSFTTDNVYSEKVSETELDQGALAPAVAPASEGPGSESERAPRPLSPTKLLPFISHPHRHPSDADLEALRRRLHHAPRPLKKRSSITEPEGPAGPNIQKLLYQKTTLAAMETVAAAGVPTTAPFYQSDEVEVEAGRDGGGHPWAPPRAVLEPPPVESEEEVQKPPPLPPRLPIPSPSPCHAAPLEEEEQESCPPSPVHTDTYLEEYPPYPPPPYPSSVEPDVGEDNLNMQPPEVTGQVILPAGKRTNLRKVGSDRIDHGMRVKFNPLALLLDSSLEGEYDLVQRVIYDVEDPSLPNDEGITALHNAVCAGHTEIVKFLVQFGVNVNAADSDGWTPLHCAASCNNVQVCKFLVESGAAVFASTYSDLQTAADKCEEMEEGYAQCSQFLYGVQEKMGIMNRGVVYALWDYDTKSDDELPFREGDCMTVLRRDDQDETDWWWARCGDREGYVPRNLLGLYLRIKPRQRSLA